MNASRLIIVLAAALALSAGFTIPETASAGVSVNINVGPPAYVFSTPPEVYYVPGSYVYYAPDVDFDIFFYGGFWYRPYEGRWFRAKSYNGPWVFIEAKRVPSVIVHVPPTYRDAPPPLERIPYHHLKKNWRRWDKEKHWERQVIHHNQQERRHEQREIQRELRHEMKDQQREQRHERQERRQEQREGQRELQRELRH